MGPVSPVTRGGQDNGGLALVTSRAYWPRAAAVCDGRFMLRLGLIALALLVSPLTASAEPLVLQNDSAAAGMEIAFYPRLQGEEWFSSVFDVPDEVPNYQICSIVLWVGPDDFSLFEVRIASADVNGQIDELIWFSNLDVYQVFGSRVELSEIDLRDEFIFTDMRRLYVRLSHAPGFNGPPTIASDADGILPGHNWIHVFNRNGTYTTTLTEGLPEEGLYPRPPGDWVLRTVIAPDGEDCPNSVAVLPDAGIVELPPDPDRGRPPAPPRDMELPDGAGPKEIGPDDGEEPADAALDHPEADARPPVVTPPLGPLSVERVVPGRGPRHRNTEVVINGEGFPFPGEVEVFIGDTRALEVEVKATSTITAIVPAGLDLGEYNVSVSRADGQEAILPSAFTVIEGETGPVVLVLSDLSPRRIIEGEAPVLTLFGHAFTASTEFLVGSVLLQGTLIVSEARATAQLTTPLAAGTYDVVARDNAVESRLGAGLTIQKRPNGAIDDGCGCATSTPGIRPSWPVLALGISCLAAARPRRRRSL